MDDLLDVLRRLQTSMGNAEVALARRMQLAPRDLTALTHIAFSETPVTPSEVGDRIGVTRGAVTELVDRLERAGHVHRERDESDRRRVELHLSPAATDRVVEHLSDLLRDLEHAFDGLTERDLAVVVGVLRRLTDAYDRYGRSPAE